MKLLQPFERLYQKTNTGAIQEWSVFALLDEGKNIGVVQVIFGQLESDKLQTTELLVKSGKNLGRSNATTVESQTIIKAQQLWDKTKKKGYVTDLDRARKGESDVGGIEPMLAEKYKDIQDKIDWSKPKVIEPKLDGMRILAIVKDFKCTLWSRQRREITHLPHIVAAVESIAKRIDVRNFTLDGEAYNHKYRYNFSDFMSIVRTTKKVHKDILDVEYHVYDIVSKRCYSERYETIKKISLLSSSLGNSHIKIIPCDSVSSEKEMLEIHDKYTSDGFEGVIVRELSKPYQFKRTPDLIKYKVFIDEEFDVVGVIEGEGKLKGHAGSFVCKMKNGETFKAKLKGPLKNLKRYFDDHSTWQGKQATVRYFNLTEYNTPRHGVAIEIRDYE